MNHIFPYIRNYSQHFSDSKQEAYAYVTATVVSTLFSYSSTSRVSVIFHELNKRKPFAYNFELLLAYKIVSE